MNTPILPRFIRAFVYSSTYVFFIMSLILNNLVNLKYPKNLKQLWSLINRPVPNKESTSKQNRFLLVLMLKMILESNISCPFQFLYVVIKLRITSMRNTKSTILSITCTKGKLRFETGNACTRGIDILFQTAKKRMKVSHLSISLDLYDIINL